MESTGGALVKSIDTVFCMVSMARRDDRMRYYRRAGNAARAIRFAGITFTTGHRVLPSNVAEWSEAIRSIKYERWL